MTVPGKGGRPRKWRSDAGRVRAFRARERCEDEPPTIEVALESGDEAAAAIAWNQVRELGITVEALTAELKATRAALRQAEKELEREQLRSSRLSEGNDRLRAALDAVERDRADLQARLAETRPHHDHTRTECPTRCRSEPSATPAGRAQAASLAVTATTHPTTHVRQRE